MNKKEADIHRYDDIIELPHHESSFHPHMQISDRAAQFAPFAALTGHEAAIRETARRTEDKIELDEDAKAVIDEKLRMIQEMLPEQPVKITVTYFQPDQEKTGGSYMTVSGCVKKLDIYAHLIIFTNSIKISFEKIYQIEFIPS